MEKNRILAIMGSPESGKTITAVKMALTLAKQKQNVIVVFCDPFTPSIPTLVPTNLTHDISLGSLLTAPSLTQTDILKACVPIPDSKYISLLGYCLGDSLIKYPKITKERAIDFFVMLRYLADYIIIDCTSIFEADPASIVAIEVADSVLQLGTANLKGISYYQTHNPLLMDSRFSIANRKFALGCLKPYQDWEVVSEQYGGVSYLLPYIFEIEKQNNELTLFQPMTEPESVHYTNQIEKILKEMFDVRIAKERVNVEQTFYKPHVKEKKQKNISSFKLPFVKNKGEF